MLSCRDANVAVESVELGVHCSVGQSDERVETTSKMYVLKELLYMEKNMIWLNKTYETCGYDMAYA